MYDPENTSQCTQGIAFSPPTKLDGTRERFCGFRDPLYATQNNSPEGEKNRGRGERDMTRIFPTSFFPLLC
jgi:hypothetical protein